MGWHSGSSPVPTHLGTIYPSHALSPLGMSGAASYYL